MEFNLSGTMVFLVQVFSHLITENYCSQVHVVTGEVPRVLKETLMLLKPLNGLRFNALDILSARQSLIFSQNVSHKSSSAFNALGHGKSSLKRSANKLKFSLQLTFL